MTFAAIEHRIRREYRTPYRAADRWIDIVNEVAAEYGVTAAEIMGRSRRVKVIYARRHAIYRIRNEVVIDGRSASWPRIGRWLGRDHTTIIYAYRNHGKKMKLPNNCIPHEYDGVRYESVKALQMKNRMGHRVFYQKRATGEIIRL